MRKSDAFPTLLRQFHLAAVLLTRLPLPHLPRQSFDKGHAAVWAYPLVGALVGVLGAIAACLSFWIGLPPVIAAGLALATMMITTGAMHEDGLADMFDGFWGAQDRDRRLAIMRDSQIGTYGVLALVLATGLRWGALALLLSESILPLIAAAAASRGAMPVLMAHLPAARQDGLSHSVGAPAMPTALVALVLGCGVALLCLGQDAVGPLIAVFVLTAIINVIARAKIGGQTGDVLGATQQLCEVLILLILCR